MEKLTKKIQILLNNTPFENVYVETSESNDTTGRNGSVVIVAGSEKELVEITPFGMETFTIPFAEIESPLVFEDDTVSSCSANVMPDFIVQNQDEEIETDFSTDMPEIPTKQTVTTTATPAKETKKVSGKSIFEKHWGKMALATIGLVMIAGNNTEEKN